MRVVLDTNVLISGLLHGGNPREILQAAITGTIELAISEDLVRELQEVLQRPRFGLGLQFVQSVIAELNSIAEWVVPQEHHGIVRDDPSDNLVVDCAVAARADYLVTGDAHLLQLEKCKDVIIVSPQAFIGVLKHR